MNEAQKIKLFIDKREYGVVQPDGSVASTNFSDFHINIILTKSINKHSEYVDINIDTYKTQIDRQLFNPLFIELAFFETVGKISSGSTIHSDSVYDKAADYKITINGA
jgi:hypothetical protein